jgi:hypothetical protein
MLWESLVVEGDLMKLPLTPGGIKRRSLVGSPPIAGAPDSSSKGSGKTSFSPKTKLEDYNKTL